MPRNNETSGEILLEKFYQEANKTVKQAIEGKVFLSMDTLGKMLELHETIEKTREDTANHAVNHYYMVKSMGHKLSAIAKMRGLNQP